MNMTKWLLYIGICLGAFIVNACTEATDVIEPAEADKVMLQLQLTLPVNEASRATEWTTEEGTAYENYINFKDPTKYRIYFFDNDNKYIARFTPSEVVMSETNNYVLYSVEGEVPEALISASKIVSFKVMILGNWKEYAADDNLIGKSIDDICSADWATFDYSENFELGFDNLIPFYGIHEYENVAFEYGEITRLEESVTLLRAMAKVEVVLETEGMSFSEVSIYGYNKQGYCAPSGVDSQTDYAQDNGKNLDLHLVDDKNDENATLNTCSFSCVKEEAGEETWVAYLPEYKNEGDKTKDAHIEIRFDIQTEEDEKDFIIYFSDDQSDITNHSFSIARNHLYRFNVTIDPKGNLAVEVKNWADIYENNFYF